MEVTDMTTIQAGHQLPEVAVPRLDRGDFSFDELRGKRALLFFWGSW